MHRLSFYCGNAARLLLVNCNGNIQEECFYFLLEHQ